MLSLHITNYSHKKVLIATAYIMVLPQLTSPTWNHSVFQSWFFYRWTMVYKRRDTIVIRQHNTFKTTGLLKLLASLLA